MRAVLSLIVVGCALGAAASWSRVARAADFTWSASRRCPNEQEVRSAVEKGLGGRLAALPEVAFEARVHEAGGAYELELKARKGKTLQERRIRTQTCAEIVDVLVAAMSLALDSLVAETDSAGSSPAPEPIEAAAPPESPSPSQSPAAPPPPTIAESHPSKRPAMTAFAAGAAIINSGVLPDAAFGGALSLGLGLGAWNARASGAFTPQVLSEFKGTNSGTFDWMAAGVGACFMPFRGLWGLRGCVDGEVGRLRGKGHNVRNPQEQSVLWLAIVPGVEGIVHPGAHGWGLFASVGVPIPLYRRSFSIGDAAVHTPAAAGLRAAVGIELELM
jgi:hypothetical protein